jgi:hypothetical protein
VLTFGITGANVFERIFEELDRGLIDSAIWR